MHSRVLGVGRALPPHYVDQETLTSALRALWAEKHHNPQRLDDLHRAVQVRGRHLALPLDAYPGLVSFEQRNAAWNAQALPLACAAAREALENAELEPADVDHVVFVTVTGLSTPSIDAKMVEPLGLRPDVKRTPIFGLGCVAGAAGVARCHDLLGERADGVALLVSVELCSLTLQREDLSITNVIASGLFGDGASAVVVAGPAREKKPAPRILATRSVFFPGTERLMGWDFVDDGFKVVLSPQVPALVKKRIGGDVDAFLASQNLARKDITHFVAHTGGPKVLQAFEEALELPPEALARSWKSLREVGNLSSSSVLFVLGDLLEEAVAKEGELGLLMAMGPGFCAEMVLLRW